MARDLPRKGDARPPKPSFVEHLSRLPVTASAFSLTTLDASRRLAMGKGGVNTKKR